MKQNLLGPSYTSSDIWNNKELEDRWEDGALHRLWLSGVDPPRTGGSLGEISRSSGVVALSQKYVYTSNTVYTSLRSTNSPVSSIARALYLTSKRKKALARPSGHTLAGQVLPLYPGLTCIF